MTNQKDLEVNKEGTYMYGRPTTKKPRFTLTILRTNGHIVCIGSRSSNDPDRDESGWIALFIPFDLILYRSYTDLTIKNRSMDLIRSIERLLIVGSI